MYNYILISKRNLADVVVHLSNKVNFTDVQLYLDPKCNCVPHFFIYITWTFELPKNVIFYSELMIYLKLTRKKYYTTINLANKY
jgi:hypothetical protein